jgi:hypothetical protein
MINSKFYLKCTSKNAKFVDFLMTMCHFRLSYSALVRLAYFNAGDCQSIIVSSCTCLQCSNHTCLVAPTCMSNTNHGFWGCNCSDSFANCQILSFQEFPMYCFTISDSHIHVVLPIGLTMSHTSATVVLYPLLEPFWPFSYLTPGLCFHKTLH